jgi:hypothetical protein
MDSLTALSSGSGADTVALQDVIKQLQPLQQVLVVLGTPIPAQASLAARQALIHSHTSAVNCSTAGGRAPA